MPTPARLLILIPIPLNDPVAIAELLESHRSKELPHTDPKWDGSPHDLPMKLNNDEHTHELGSGLTLQGLLNGRVHPCAAAIAASHHSRESLGHSVVEALMDSEHQMDLVLKVFCT